MKAHFFNLKREYLGTLDINAPPDYEYLRIPIITPLEIPLRLEEPPQLIPNMGVKTFRATPVYKGLNEIDFMIYLEVK